MNTLKKTVSAFFCFIIMLSLSACTLPFLNGNPTDEKPEKIDTNYHTYTKIYYSAGSDANWSYGTFRKEFPRNEACYVRIISTVVAEKNRGVGSGITVTYRFTGAQNCSVELSDGIATQVDSGDPNVIIYTRTIEAAKEKKAKESFVTFQYTPNSDATSIKLEVTYDEHVPEKFDDLNTIYFSKNSA